MKSRKKKTKTKNQTHRYREQTGGCQKQGVEVRGTGEGCQKVQTSSYNIKSPGDVMQSMATTVNNTGLHI